jgi:hypothetical protein
MIEPLAAAAVVGNDSPQTLGPYLSSNRGRTPLLGADLLRAGAGAEPGAADSAPQGPECGALTLGELHGGAAAEPPALT